MKECYVFFFVLRFLAVRQAELVNLEADRQLQAPLASGSRYFKRLFQQRGTDVPDIIERRSAGQESW